MPVTFNNVTINRVGLHGGRDKLLDKFPGAAAAYSLRVLNTDYRGPVVQVRESANNAEADFTAIEVADGTLAAWVGAGNDGFVKTWYDQSGNSIDTVQTSLTIQPKIVNNGSIIEQNGKSAIEFKNESYLTYGDPIINLYAFGVGVVDTIGNFNTFFCTRPDSGDSGNLRTDGVNKYYRSPSTNSATSGEYTNINGELYFNSKLMTTSDDVRTYHIFSAKRGAVVSNLGLTIGRSFTNRDFIGRIQELILYSSDQSSNRTGIESNIATHYGITLS